MSEWRPIKTAPKAKPVLVFDAGEVSVAVLQPSTMQWQGLVDGGIVGLWTTQGQFQFYGVGKPSHWMPIPAPPERPKNG